MLPVLIQKIIGDILNDDITAIDIFEPIYEVKFLNFTTHIGSLIPQWSAEAFDTHNTSHPQKKGKGKGKKKNFQQQQQYQDHSSGASSSWQQPQYYNNNQQQQGGYYRQPQQQQQQHQQRSHALKHKLKPGMNKPWFVYLIVVVEFSVVIINLLWLVVVLNICCG